MYSPDFQPINSFLIGSTSAIAAMHAYIADTTTEATRYILNQSFLMILLLTALPTVLEHFP